MYHRTTSPTPTIYYAFKSIVGRTNIFSCTDPVVVLSRSALPIRCADVAAHQYPTPPKVHQGPFDPKIQRIRPIASASMAMHALPASDRYRRFGERSECLRRLVEFSWVYHAMNCGKKTAPTEARFHSILEAFGITFLSLTSGVSCRHADCLPL